MTRSKVDANDATSEGLRAEARCNALITKFTKILPGWLRRSGVKRAYVEDAVQEALEEALRKLPESLAGKAESENGAFEREELMRIVSNVALRVRRRVQRENDRYLNIENVEMASVHDEESWVEARVIVLMALENLDEASRSLIYAHEVEGRTNGEIAAALHLNEDAVEKRVFFAKQKLRSEIEQIERGLRRPKSKLGLDALPGALAVDFKDSFDQAFFGAYHEVCGKKPFGFDSARESSPTSSPTSSQTLSRSLSKPQGFIWPTLPTTALVGVLVLAPVVPESIEPLIEGQVSTANLISTSSLPSLPANTAMTDEKVVVSHESEDVRPAERGSGELISNEAASKNVLPVVMGPHSIHSSGQSTSGAKSSKLIVPVKPVKNIEENKAVLAKEPPEVDPRWYRVESGVAPP